MLGGKHDRRIRRVQGKWRGGMKGNVRKGEEEKRGSEGKGRRRGRGRGQGRGEGEEGGEGEGEEGDWRRGEGRVMGSEG